MTKITLEDALKARRADPRALRGALTFAGGAARITFGTVGTIRRFSLAIEGDEITIVNDPRPEEEADEPGGSESLEDQIAAMKVRADDLDVKYNANIGLPALTKKVEEAEAKTNPD